MADRDYEVGYGRPPKQTQFQKGQSGNPKGRKKGAKGLKTILREEQSQRVVVNENGKTIEVSKLRLTLKNLTNKAAKGDLRAIEKLIELNVLLFGPEDEAGKTTATLPSEDEAIISDWLKRRSEGESSD